MERSYMTPSQTSTPWSAVTVIAYQLRIVWCWTWAKSAWTICQKLRLNLTRYCGPRHPVSMKCTWTQRRSEITPTDSRAEKNGHSPSLLTPPFVSQNLYAIIRTQPFKPLTHRHRRHHISRHTTCSRTPTSYPPSYYSMQKQAQVHVH